MQNYNENAANAANAIQLTTLETLLNNGKEILFIEANRNCLVKGANVSGKIKSLKLYGVLTPFQLIPAAFAAEEGLVLLDAKGSKVSDPERISNGYCILDGNNRYKARLEIQRKADKDRASGKMPEVGKGLDDVPVMVHTEKPASVLTALMEINTSNVKWNFGDYASTALKLDSENEILQLIVELKEECKFPPNTISLYLTFKGGKIRDNHLADAIKSGNRNPEFFKSVKVDRARKILDTLRGVGFDNKALKKKYLIEWIIGEADRFEEVLNAISQLTKAEVTGISDGLGKDPEFYAPILAKLEQQKAA